MSRDLNLRRVNASTYRRHQALSRCQRNGLSVQEQTPAAGAGYISFWAQGTEGLWRGMVDALQWLAATAPKLQQLLPAGCDLGAIAGLFASIERPVEPCADTLPYQRLFEVAQHDGLPALVDAVLCLQTPQGPLWLLEAPSHPTRNTGPLRPWVLSLTQTLTLSLGTTYLNRSQLTGLHPGGVIRITRPEQRFLLSGEQAGRFIFSEEGVHMQPNPIQNVQSTLTNDLSDMKIKLEFVLQEQKLSLAQLSEFFEGEVLKIDPQATAAIQVRVSGQVVAVGELVRLDDSLAVELRQICRGVGNE